MYIAIIAHPKTIASCGQVGSLHTRAFFDEMEAAKWIDGVQMSKGSRSEIFNTAEFQSQNLKTYLPIEDKAIRSLLEAKKFNEAATLFKFKCDALRLAHSMAEQAKEAMVCAGVLTPEEEDAIACS